VGWFLSLTQAGADDVTTGLQEILSFGGGPFEGPPQRYWIGLKNRGAALPGTANVSFAGFTNRPPGNADGGGDSRLDSSDKGLGTSNAYFWRPNNWANPSYSFLMLDGQITRASGGGAVGNALAQHFPQDPVGAGGYTVLLAMRLTRPTPGSKTITVYVKSAADSADVLYSDTPSTAEIEDALRAWPASYVIGPVELARVPDAIYCSWPFQNSRLRIHSVGVLKAA
jgi:hypothetical protein